VGFAVESSLLFQRQAKRLLKKYPSLVTELEDLITSLAVSPKQGVALGKDLYKVRLAIRSKGSGRSGGARVITCLKVVSQRVILAAIYDKSELDTLTDRELAAIARNVLGD
jgi:hypothetical protein